MLQLTLKQYQCKKIFKWKLTQDTPAASSIKWINPTGSDQAKKYQKSKWLLAPHAKHPGNRKLEKPLGIFPNFLFLREVCVIFWIVLTGSDIAPVNQLLDSRFFLPCAKLECCSLRESSTTTCSSNLSMLCFHGNGCPVRKVSFLQNTWLIEAMT